MKSLLEPVRDVIPAKARLPIYAVWVLLWIIIGAVKVGLASAGVTGGEVVLVANVAADVLWYLGGPVVILASVNVPVTDDGVIELNLPDYSARHAK